jgi:predicted nuclease of restriction endonuclease-like (RecB) superfamily
MQLIWSKQHFQERQIASALFERLAVSSDQDTLKRLSKSVL